MAIIMKSHLFFTSLIALLTLAGCASSAQDKQRQIEMLAQSRASVLSSTLPIEKGPLSVMKASANKGTVEIMMLYNTDAKGAKPIEEVIRSSMNYYCTDSEVKTNLDMGLAYRILIRNTRGQLMSNQYIDNSSCSKPANDSEKPAN